jgi:hypothetical protein
MADLNKKEITAEIQSKLAIVSQNLSILDALTGKRDKAVAERDAHRHNEKVLMAAGDDASIDELLAVRGRIDLKNGAIQALDEKIEAAEEAILQSGTKTAQLVDAYHAAALVALKAHIADVTKVFIRPEDAHSVWTLALQHPDVRQAAFSNTPIFMKDHLLGYRHSTQNARLLPAVFSQVAEVAEKIPGAIWASVPEAWL